MGDRPLVPFPLAGQDPIAVRAEIMSALGEFWEGRDPAEIAALHHPMWLRQFAGWGWVVRDHRVPSGPVPGIVPGLPTVPGGAVVAYLLGVVTADRIGYVHAVATRRSHRGQGLARALWASFTARAEEAGATELQAISTPGNSKSISFHTALGMDVTTIQNYKGEGEHRVLFRRALP